MLSTIKLKKNLLAGLILLLIVVAAGILFGYFYQRDRVLAEEHKSLSATGTIEAKNVMLAFKVPGRIEEIFVEEGSKVEKGQELARLDSREIEAKLLQAQGAYNAALGQASQAETAVPLTGQTVEASIKQAEAMVAKAEVGVTNTRQQYERAKSLHESGAVSDAQLDGATNAYDAAQKDLQAAQGKLNEANSARLQTDVAQSRQAAANGQSQQALGAVQEAQAFLDNTHLKAPIAGYITQKVLEEGEMLNAGTPVFEITDLNSSYVKVYIDESKIGRVQLEQTAEVKVDSFPDRVYTGKVVWINDAGQFAVRKAVNEQYSHDIRSFEVKIDIPNEDLSLKTGMTASVKILDEE